MLFTTTHSELVPGDCFPDGLDAVGAARRLLAAARDALADRKGV